LGGEGALEIGIDQLIGVDMGRVGWQEVQLDLVGSPRDPVDDLLRAVSGVPVNDQVDLLLELAQQPVEEGDEDLGVERLVQDGEVQLAPGRNGRHRTEPEAVSVRATVGVWPLRPQVRPASWSERTPDLIPEQDACPLGTSPLTQGRVGLLDPLSHRPGSASIARLSGRWKLKPMRRRNLPMPCSVKDTPNSCSARTQTFRRVHSFPPRSRMSGS
jgi:hypothetical protein